MQAEGVGDVVENQPLKNFTTWKIGGLAKLFVEPDSLEALQKTVMVAKDENIPWFIIGKGSNILIKDEGINGLVIHLGEGFKHFSNHDGVVRVGAGYSLIGFATQLSKQGWKGMEFAGGIPGTIGGAVFMNAGAHGSDMSCVLTKAHLLYPDGQLSWVNCDDMGFDYRTSRLQEEGAICVEAEMSFEEGDLEEITKKLQGNKDYRKQSQPWNDPCCGSVFRNPLPYYAGDLIERAGLKGCSVGDAQVSLKHANFIINKGNATAHDVFSLIQYIQGVIYDHFQVEMKTEVEVINL
nr:UDP-N-acetylmuramate dehydrogenase [Texcoconibacillus texcoconensis]